MVHDNLQLPHHEIPILQPYITINLLVYDPQLPYKYTSKSGVVRDRTDRIDRTDRTDRIGRTERTNRTDKTGIKN